MITNKKSISRNGGEGSGGRAVKILTIGLTVILMSAGCSIKKKENPSSIANHLELLKALPDADNDGISDELERLSGTNPNIADIPKISIALVSDISIGAIFRPSLENLYRNKFSILKQEFFEVDNSKGGDLETLKVLRKKVVKNQYNHLRNIKAEKSDIITVEDLRSNILSSWSDDQFYPYLALLNNFESYEENDSGKFATNLKIKINHATNVTEISDIALKSFFYDNEESNETEIYNHYLLKASGSKERFKLSGNESYSPVMIYPLIANEIKSSIIYSKLKNRSEIGIKFSDYSYTTSGVQLSYAEVLNKVMDLDAKIIYSDGLKTEVFFANPNLTLAEVLKQLGFDILLNKNGEIYSINGIEASAKYPLDIDNLGIDDFKKGIWSVFGDGDSLTDQMKPQGIYVVSFVTIGEILKNSKKWSSVLANEIQNVITIDNIYEGDEILIDVKDLKYSTIIESLTRKVTNPILSGSGCNFVEEFAKGPGCREIPGCFEDIAIPVNAIHSVDLSATDIEDWFAFYDSYGEKVNAKIYRYGSIIRIIFNDLKNYLKNTIKISIKDPLNQKSTARRGIVGGTCNPPSFSEEKFMNQFNLSGSIKIYGINKY